MKAKDDPVSPHIHQTINNVGRRWRMRRARTRRKRKGNVKMKRKNQKKEMEEGQDLGKEEQGERWQKTRARSKSHE